MERNHDLDALALAVIARPNDMGAWSPFLDYCEERGLGNPLSLWSYINMDRDIDSKILLLTANQHITFDTCRWALSLIRRAPLAGD